MKLRTLRTLDRAINNIKLYLDRNPRDAMQQARLATLKKQKDDGKFRKGDD